MQAKTIDEQENYTSIEIGLCDEVKYYNNDHWYHRLDGPAIEYQDGYKEWYINGSLVIPPHLEMLGYYNLVENFEKYKTMIIQICIFCIFCVFRADERCALNFIAAFKENGVNCEEFEIIENYIEHLINNENILA